MLFRYDPRYTEKVTASGRCTISVLGATLVQEPGPLHRIGGSLNVERYIKILEDDLISFVPDGPFPDRFIFLQHDRSPGHKVKVVNDFLDVREIRLRPWPPTGVHQNVIKNIWGS